MKRLGEFLRSVIPADPAQLIYLAGLVCLTICVRMSWFTSVPSEVGPLSPQQFTFQVYPFLVIVSLLCRCAAIAGYYNCFWPGGRPLRRLLVTVVVPAGIAFAAGCGGLLHVTGRLYPHSVLENAHTFLVSIAGAPIELLKLGLGFRVLALGILLVLFSASRMAFGVSSLPISVAGSVNTAPEDLDLWRRTQTLIWIFVSPLFLLLSNSLLLVWAAIPKIHSRDDFSWFVYLGSAFFMVGICSLVLKSGRSQILQSVKSANAKYLVLGGTFPIVISGIFPLAFYVYNRIQWAAHDFGRFAPPRFFEYEYSPSPWLLFLFFPALGEEIIFRGILQQQLIRRYGLWRGIFLVSIVWGAFHFPSDSFYDAEYYMVFLGLAMRLLVCLALGFVFSWLTLKSESVLPGAFAHGLINFFLDSKFGPEFIGKDYIWLLLWGMLAFILYRYWPISEAEPKEGMLAPIEPEPAV